MDSYIGNPGSGYMTSSPCWQSARIVYHMMGFAPGVTTTRSGPAESRPFRSRNSATASRSSGMPGAGT